MIRVLPRVGPETFDYNRGSRELGHHVKKQMLEHQRADWHLAQDSRAFWHNIRSLYNYRGAFVESYIAWKLRADPIYRRIDTFVPQAGVVLDAGCGYGLMSNILARKSLDRRVIGVDLDPRKIRVAGGTALAVPNVQFELGNLLDTPFPEAQAVILVDVLHYWSKPRQRDLIAKACKALRPGGVLLFREACKSSGWRHRLTVWSERMATVLGHNRAAEGLYFYDEDFHLHAFQSNGLVLQDRPENLGRGSNEVFILRKDS